jgi:hypothetical protein
MARAAAAMAARISAARIYIVVRDASMVTTIGLPLLSNAFAVSVNSAAVSSSSKTRVFRMISPRTLGTIKPWASSRGERRHAVFPFSAEILGGRLPPLYRICRCRPTQTNHVFNYKIYMK